MFISVRRIVQLQACITLAVALAAGWLSSEAFAQGQSPSLDPVSLSWKPIHLPVLDDPGQATGCTSLIAAQNVGGEPIKAALLTFGEPGACPPGCSGPSAVVCSGVIRPGATWYFDERQLPADARSGALYSFTMRMTQDFDPYLCVDDLPIADLLCDVLRHDVVRDCDNYRRFNKAYGEGLEFYGIGMNRAAGRATLTAQAVRTCPDAGSSGAVGRTTYSGSGRFDLGSWDPVFRGYAYYLPMAQGGPDDAGSIVHVQNAGLECAAVELWLKGHEDCDRSLLCDMFQLAPGEAHQVDISGCVGPDWRGSAWLRGGQPLAVVVETVAPGSFASYSAQAPESPWAWGSDPDLGWRWAAGRTLQAPLVYHGHQGWTSAIWVQNQSPSQPARVKLSVLDRSGSPVATLLDWVCPRGSQRFDLEAVSGLPDGFVGSVLPESQPWWSAGDPSLHQPQISAVATLFPQAGSGLSGLRTDVKSTGSPAAVAYSLLEYDVQPGAWFLDQVTVGHTAVVAVPRLISRAGRRRHGVRAGRDEPGADTGRNPVRGARVRPQRAGGALLRDVARAPDRLLRPAALGLRGRGLRGQRRDQRDGLEPRGGGPGGQSARRGGAGRCRCRTRRGGRGQHGSRGLRYWGRRHPFARSRCRGDRGGSGGDGASLSLGGARAISRRTSQLHWRRLRPVTLRHWIPVARPQLGDGEQPSWGSALPGAAQRSTHGGSPCQSVRPRQRRAARLLGHRGWQLSRVIDSATMAAARAPCRASRYAGRSGIGN